MSQEQQQNEPSRDASAQLDPFAIAAGMLRSDIHLLLPMLGVLALSAIFQTLTSPTNVIEIAGVVFLDRVIQLAIMSTIVLRWRRKLEHIKGSLSNPLLAALRIVVAGVVIWGSLTLPVVGASFANLNWASPLFLFIFFCAVYLSFRFYFYFATFGLLGGTLREACAAATALGRREPLAAVRSLIAPVAVTGLVVGLLWYPSPDGRSLFWATAASAAEGIFWVLSTYTGLACALPLIDESLWRAAGLDPYRQQRLRTLEAQGRASRFNWLSTSSGVKIFVVAACVIIGDLVQGFTLEPAARIMVESYQVRDREISVVLDLSDPVYQFRGFNPYAFSLATQTGLEVISDRIEKVSLAPGGEFLRGSFPAQTGPVRLYLNFRSRKTDEVLRGMDNLYLWYNLTAVAPLRPIKGASSQAPLAIEGDLERGAVPAR
ncbi:MAG: hypothetical protein RIS36_1374 [Pseudomonadota bacterium]|jgi:hypothetical protein